jgi:hypothetical protein
VHACFVGVRATRVAYCYSEHSVVMCLDGYLNIEQDICCEKPTASSCRSGNGLDGSRLTLKKTGLSLSAFYENRPFYGLAGKFCSSHGVWQCVSKLRSRRNEIERSSPTAQAKRVGFGMCNRQHSAAVRILLLRTPTYLGESKAFRQLGPQKLEG